MFKGRRVAVVIPAYNVAPHIVGVLERMPDCVDDVIVVDDGASDATAERVQGMAAQRVSLIRHDRNQGVGAAVVSGFRQALERGAEIVVKIDGDGQMDPQCVPTLIDPIAQERYDYVKGNRFLGEEHLREMPALRMVGSFGLTFLTKVASGYWNVFDSVNGSLAIDARTLRRLPLQRIARRYFFETDMLIHLNVLRARVHDVALPARYGSERSSMRLGTVLWTFPLFLARGFFYRLYQRHVLREFSPVAIFWIFGLVLLAWGGGFGAFAWIRSIRTGQVATTGTVMLSVLPFILGFQLALQAILVEIQESTRG